ncbi:hypothetical protein [Reyranella sp.]|uniref:hypothetical protein n=1 Tax=Reyranella sp. TaxID=1929291 RepID=UPI003C7B6E31
MTRHARKADLPPRGVWIAGTTGLARWRPEVDQIQVYRTAEGKVLELKLSGVVRQIALDQAQADHLAALLKGTP